MQFETKNKIKAYTVFKLVKKCQADLKYTPAFLRSKSSSLREPILHLL